MGWGRADPPPRCPSAASGERRAAGEWPRTPRGARGWRCPRPGARGGSRRGGGGRLGPGRSGVIRGQRRPRGRAWGGRAERMLRALRSGPGGQEPPRPPPGAGGGAERPPGRAGGPGGKPGGRRPCPPQHRPGPGLRSLVSPRIRGSAGASRRSPFRSQPAGPSAILPPAAGPAASPLPELIPGLPGALPAASAVLWPPPAPEPPGGCRGGGRAGEMG